MNSIQALTDFFATGLLLATFLMMGKVRLVPMLRYFGISSLCLAGLGASVSMMKGETDFFLAPIATVLIKAVAIPLIIYVTSKKIPSSNVLRMNVKPATTYFLFGLVLAMSGLIVQRLPVAGPESLGNPIILKGILFISFTLILSGILLTVIRRDLFSQVLGILTLENGIAAFALVALEGIPLFLEMGIFLVIMASTVILATLTSKVHETYTTGDTANLNELTD